MSTVKKKKIGLSLEPLLKANEDKLIQIKISKLIPGKFQPRRTFSEQELAELSDSIKANGVLQPLLVRESGSSYEIIAGERRWRASKLAGLAHVPAIVSHISDEQALAYGVVENIQRQDLNPIEEALAIQRLIEEFGMTHDEVSSTLGKKRSTISNMLRLLKMTTFAQDSLAEGRIELSQAKLLAGMHLSEQNAACEYMIQNDLSVRETDFFLKSAKKSKSVSKATHTHPSADEWEKKLAHMLQTKVKLKVNESGKGKIEIFVADDFQIKQVIDSVS